MIATGASATKKLDIGMHSKVDSVMVEQTLRCGALARATGVSPDTIRHYERIGVLPRALRSPAGYRIYPNSMIQRVQVIQRALRIGFTLAELSEILKARDSGGAPCHRVYQLAQGKLEDISDDIKALQRMEKYLKKVLADWKLRMRKAGQHQKAMLLYSLTDAVKDVDSLSNRIGRNRR